MNIRLNLTQYDNEKHFAALIDILEKNQGRGSLVLHLEDGNGAFTQRVIARKFSPNINSGFFKELEKEIDREDMWLDVSSPF